MLTNRNPKIGLVYLNRRAEGILPVKRFIDSYKAFNTGVGHEFITIYKGFTASDRDIAKRLFEGIEHRNIVVDDEMTDIETYLIAAESFPDVDMFCFLNTFSEIVCKNWLLILSNALSADNVGIAGATASYESLLNSVRLNSKVIWLCDNNYLKYDRKLHLQHKSNIEKHTPHWLRKFFVSRLLSRLRAPQTVDYDYLATYDAEFEEFWKILTGRDGVFAFLNGYPSFPNPHIRSNALMIRRVHLLPFFGECSRMSKNDSYLFESGANGLTRRILNNKLRAVVVNSHGNMFDVEEWSQSQTFRLGNQQGLLVHDNQTRNFQKFNLAEKDVHIYMSWGNSSKYLSRRIFTFGIPFEVKLG